MLSRFILPAILGLFVGNIQSQLTPQNAACLTLPAGSVFQKLCYQAANVTSGQNANAVQNISLSEGALTRRALTKRAATSVIITTILYADSDTRCSQTPGAVSINDGYPSITSCQSFATRNSITLDTCTLDAGIYLKYSCAENATVVDTASALLKSLPSAYWWQDTTYATNQCNASVAYITLARAGGVSVTVDNDCGKITCSGTTGSACLCDGTRCSALNGTCDTRYTYGSSGKCVGSGAYSAASINKPYLWTFLLVGVIWASL